MTVCSARDALLGTLMLGLSGQILAVVAASTSMLAVMRPLLRAGAEVRGASVVASTTYVIQRVSIWSEMELAHSAYLARLAAEEGKQVAGIARWDSSRRQPGPVASPGEPSWPPTADQGCSHSRQELVAEAQHWGAQTEPALRTWASVDL